MSVSDTYLQQGDNLYQQADVHSRRQVEALLRKKASYKQGWQTTGDLLTGAGMTGMAASQEIKDEDDRRKAFWASAGVTFLGVLASGASESIDPKADTRAIHNLPGIIWLGGSSLPDPTLSIRTDSYYSRNHSIHLNSIRPELSTTLPFQAKPYSIAYSYVPDLRTIHQTQTFIARQP